MGAEIMTVGDMLNRVVAEFTSTHSEADMARKATSADAIELMQQAMMIGKALLERDIDAEAAPEPPDWRPRRKQKKE